MTAVAKQPFPHILEQSIKTIAVISAWIILWRSVIAIGSKYLLVHAPEYWRVALIGLCELTNGCLSLQMIENESIRFIFAACLLSSGGMCVATQTKSVTKNLGTGMYFPGKVMQTLISFILSTGLGIALYKEITSYVLYILVLVATLLLLVTIFIVKKFKNKW